MLVAFGERVNCNDDASSLSVPGLFSVAMRHQNRLTVVEAIHYSWC